MSELRNTFGYTEERRLMRESALDLHRARAVAGRW